MSDTSTRLSTPMLSEEAPALLETGRLRPALALRDATLKRMVEQVSREPIPVLDAQGRTTLTYPLKNLAVRTPGDGSRALLDAMATVSDVTAFYQERLAAEGFLPTATEPRSVQELVSAIGHEPAPAVSATVWLAFTLEDGPNAPESVTIPAGFKVQSLPHGDEKAQIFETLTPLVARPALNALVPAPEPDLYPAELARVGARDDADLETWPVDSMADIAVIKDSAGKEHWPDPITGEYLDNDPDSSDVLNDEARDEGGDMTVSSEPSLPATLKDSSAPEFLPDPDADDGKPHDEEDPLAPGESHVVATPPLRFRRGYRGRITLEAGTSPLKVGDRLLWLRRETSRFRVMLVSRCTALKGGKGWSVRLTVERIGTRLEGLEPGYYLLSEPIGFFGHNAARWRKQDDPATDPRPPTAWNYDRRGFRSIWQNQDGHFFCENGGPHAHLERAVDDLGKDRLLLLEDTRRIRGFWTEKAVHGSLAEYGLSGRTTALWIKALTSETSTSGWPATFIRRHLKPTNAPLSVKIHLLKHSFTIEGGATRLSVPRFDRRKTLASIVALKPLPLAKARRVVIGNVPSSTDPAPSTTLGSYVPELKAGSPLLVTGDAFDGSGPVSKLVHLESVSVSKDSSGQPQSEVVFQQGTPELTLQNVRLNANVVLAVHGESIEELLGSGNGTPHQQFTLRRGPLSWESTPGGGLAPSLEIRVNGVRWSRVSTLWQQTADTPCYTAQTDAAGRTRISFGDGSHGALLPTGRDNITARYRVGGGSLGNVGVLRVTSMPARLQGIKAVTNPVVASGGAEAETPAQARVRAPDRLVGLERIVSLRDYEAFARSFPGVAHASLVPGKNGLILGVFGEDGQSIGPDRRQALLKALTAASNPLLEVTLEDGVCKTFALSATLTIDPNYRWSDVQAGAQAALQAAFSFSRRAAGQAVSDVELFRVLHAVPGVLAVAISSVDPRVVDPLDAEGKIPQVLVLDPTKLTLSARYAQMQEAP